jgi:glycosyltransferase involved in cell wall biosynthesis
MNILLINHQIRPELSGVAMHFDYIAKNLLLLGHSVTRLSAKDRGFKDENPTIHYIYFPYKKRVSGKTSKEEAVRVKQNYQNFEESLKKINWENVDSIITSNDIYLTILKKYAPSKRMLAIIPSPLKISSQANTEDSAAIIARVKKNAKNVRLVVLSSLMKKILRESLGKGHKISVIPPGVDMEKFSKPKLRRGSGILFVGRISKEKNIEALLDAMSKLRNSSTLTLVGAGKDLQKMKGLAKCQTLKKQKVCFVGRKRRVENYYARNSIFVLPSKYEAFGLVILEAMASGLPVIAFKPQGGIVTASDEVITDKIDGFLVKNTTEMADKISTLLNDRNLLKKMSANALVKAQKFNWEIHTKRLLQLIS